MSKRYVEIVHISEKSLPSMFKAGCLFRRIALGIQRYQDNGDEVRFVDDIKAEPGLVPGEGRQIVLGGTLKGICVENRRKNLLRLGFRGTDVTIDDEITFE